ncbi:MAG: carbohydrate binding family 9 domain-containing protein [Gemmatimonadales bacterium]|nr:carbohydrate binding family 9 domain-containing protein [Gemmatimonadales bacterium]
MLPFVLLLQGSAQLAQPAVEGRGAPTVTIPRIEAAAQIDGRLDEPVWTRAVRLTGFHQYQPVDSRPAEERTDVLVWYSPKALHFGVVAFDRQPNSIRASVADRDNLGADDRIVIYLDTFNDRRRAFFFGVNPLGAQEDGVRTEGSTSAGNLFGGSIDLNPDYYFESKGMVTDSGYVVEIRIPFKSLRYPGNGPQRWGLNFVRNVQRTGYEDTWTDVRRANASFLAQAGSIDGLHDLDRGLVAEIQPFVTATANGATNETSGRFERDALDPDVGVNARLGLTNLSIDLTGNPDFSQVETDEGLVTVNERFALFFPEKRPFFLEGIELFSTPNQLVYSRRVADPVVGAKFTGKFGRLGLAHLTAIDETDGDNALFNITRVQRDLGANSLTGFTVTHRDQGRNYNRVVAGDARIVFAKLYFVDAQLGGSWTRDASGTRSAALWRATFDRTGRSWGFNYQITGIGDDFESQAGFVPRDNFVTAHAFNRLTFYGGRGALIENFTTFFGPTRLWTYTSFGSEGAIEGGESATFNLQLRGGWFVSASVNRGFQEFDPDAYATFQVDRGGGALEAFVPQSEIDNQFTTSLSLTTPTYQTFDASASWSNGEVPIFDEAAEGRETRIQAGVRLRPTGSIRVAASIRFSRIRRKLDDSEFARTILPRLKIEYQPTRALFFRVIGEYRSQRRAALVDPRTGDPLLIESELAARTEINTLRMDWLASYEPTPGTVVFLGYGATLSTPKTLNFSDLRREIDGFFVKLAYQFRR